MGELLAVDIDTGSLVKIGLVLSGIFTLPDRLQGEQGLSSDTSEVGIGVIDNIQEGGVIDDNSPVPEEVEVGLSLGFVVAGRELSGLGEVVIEEDTVLDGLGLEVVDQLAG